MISIEIEGLRELGIKLSKLKKANPAKRIASEKAKFLVREMKSTCPFWHGTLMKSIQSHPTNYGYNIHMESYGEGLETGHKIEKGDVSELLTQWATDKLISPKGWLSIVRKFGWWVKPQPFIGPALRKLETEGIRIDSFVIKSVFKECGFR